MAKHNLGPAFLKCTEVQIMYKNVILKRDQTDFHFIFLNSKFKIAKKNLLQIEEIACSRYQVTGAWYLVPACPLILVPGVVLLIHILSHIKSDQHLKFFFLQIKTRKKHVLHKKMNFIPPPDYQPWLRRTVKPTSFKF